MDNKFPNQLFVLTGYLPSALQIQSCWFPKIAFKLSIGTATHGAGAIEMEMDTVLQGSWSLRP